MRRTITVIVNLFIGIMSYGAWIGMAILVREGNALSTNGFSSLKYFTVLSNLFNGIICLLYAFWLMQKKEITRTKKVWKYMATTSVGLTFVTVMVFLGPLYGYGMMFTGANFWLHLILPVMSILSFVLLERDCRLSFRDTFYAMGTPFLYGTAYVVNILIRGKGPTPYTNDFYGFLNWGNGVGAIIAVMILLVTWMIGCFLYRIGGLQITELRERR